VENYTKVLQQANYVQYIINSFWVAFVSTSASLVLGVPAAYAMSRFRMNRSSLVVLMARVIPGISLLVPWYYVFSNLHMVGGYTVLILSHMFVALPLIVYIMMGYFDSLPIELEESAQVDGLTPIGAFRRITLPLSTPGMATAETPISLKISAVSPGGERYLSFFMSSSELIGFLNQPSGSGPIGWTMNGSTLTFRPSANSFL